MTAPLYARKIGLKLPEAAWAGSTGRSRTRAKPPGRTGRSCAAAGSRPTPWTWAASVRAEGVVRFPYGQAALALIAEQDIAAAAVRVLLDSGHAGQTYVLTGGESLTQIRQAEAIGKAIGRPVRFEELSPEQFRQFADEHFPAPVVEDLLTALASYVGQTAYMTADLEKIIGRPATSYAQWAVQHADAYR